MDVEIIFVSFVHFKIGGKIAIYLARGKGPRDSQSFAGRGNQLVLTQRASQQRQLLGNLYVRKKILQLTANGISAISINREGERETEAENRREERKGKRSRAKGIHDKRIREISLLRFCLYLLGYADSRRVTHARALRSCGRRLRKFFIHVLVLSLGGFLSKNIDMNSRDPR